MKGLASTNEMFSRVNVSGRCARKHYGMQSNKKFDPVIHAQIADKRYDPLSSGVSLHALRQY